MRTRPHMLLPMVLVLSLGACCGGGGGGDGPGSNPATSESATAPLPLADSDLQQYVGEWLACRPWVTGSASERLVLHAGDAASLEAVVTTTYMDTPGCTGPVLLTQVVPMTFAPEGQKTIASDTVRKITITHENGMRFKQVMIIRGDGMLYLGDPTAALDVNGYPDTLSTMGRTRQSPGFKP